jgi:hypothetical protein
VARNLVDDLGDGSARERQPAGEHLVEHDTEREQVGALVHGVPVRLFGRHVQHGADECAGQGGALASAGGTDNAVDIVESEQLGDAEIQHLHQAARGHHQVGALDVAVDDAAPVRLVQSLGDLQRHLDGHVAGTPALRQASGQQLALHQFHDDEGRALVLADVVHRGDVGRGQRGSGAGLVEQAGAGRSVVLDGAREELERDPAAEPCVLGGEDVAHRARTQALGDAVVQHLRACHDRTNLRIIAQASGRAPRAPTAFASAHG